MFSFKKSSLPNKTDLLFSDRSLLLLIAPLVVEQMLFIFVGMADTVMISSTGEASVSAISLVDSIFMLFVSLFGAFANGGAVVTGQFLGRKAFGEAKSSAAQLLWFSAIVGVVISIALGMVQEQFIRTVYGQLEPEVYNRCLTYMSIVNLSIPFLSVMNAAAAIFRTMGNSKTTLIVAVIMNIINVVGNAVLIYIFKFEVAGAAIPTLVSRIFACVILIYLLYKLPTRLCLRGSMRFHLDKAMLGKILRIGVPNGVDGISFHLGRLLLTSIISTMGTAAITANAVSGSIAGLNMVAGMAFATATLTIISRCIGANDYEQARYFNRKLMAYSYLTAIVLSGLVILLMDPIIFLFNLSDETGVLVEHLTTFYAVSFMIVWIPAFQLPNTLRSAGDTRFTMIVSVFSMWCFRLVGGYVLAIPLQLGVQGVWYAMVLDWVVRATFFTFRYRGTAWMKKKVI